MQVNSMQPVEWNCRNKVGGWEGWVGTKYGSRVHHRYCTQQIKSEKKNETGRGSSGRDRWKSQLNMLQTNNQTNKNQKKHSICRYQVQNCAPNSNSFRTSISVSLTSFFLSLPPPQMTWPDFASFHRTSTVEYVMMQLIHVNQRNHPKSTGLIRRSMDIPKKWRSNDHLMIN